MKMKNNKKGFTLMELITVIVILAIVITVAGISIVNIKKNVLEKERKNLQAEIKAAAQSYHDETGLDTIPVGLLLQIGALQADTTEYDQGSYEIGDPVILDPVDGEPINCDAITFDSEGNVKYEYGIGCSAETLSEIGLTVFYTVGDGNTTQVSDDWIALEEGETLTLSIYNPDDTVEYKWINLLAPDKSQIGKTIDIEIPENNLINAQYRVEATINGVQSSTDFVLKVDAKVPTIENEYMSQELVWATNKDMVAIISDNESTIAGYYLINLDKETKCPTADSTKWQTAGLDLTNGTSNYNFDINITENGTYSVCAKDVAGHVTMASSSYTEENIDSKAPTIKVETVDGASYTKNKDATVTVTDEGAGFDGGVLKFRYGWSTADADKVTCDSLTLIGEIYPSTIEANGGEVLTASTTINIADKTGEGQLYICPVENGIKDRLGNTINKNEKVNAVMYLDNEVPTIDSITIASTQSKYNSYKVNVTLNNISDAHVGMGYICITNSNDSNTCTWQEVTNSDINYTFTNVTAGTEGSGSTITLYAFGKDKLGNVMPTSTTNTYKIYKYCTEQSVKGYGSYGSCTKKCDTGTKYRDVYYMDKYFNDQTCPTVSNGDSTSCNTQACCDSTHYTLVNGTNCVVGSNAQGTYNQLAYSTWDNTIRCKNFDQSSGGSTCCTTGSWTYDYCSSKGYKVYKRSTTCSGVSTSYTSSEACDSDYTYGSWSSCSASCGGGTQTKSCYYYRGGVKKTCTSLSQSCNTQACCTTSAWSYSSCSSRGYKIYTRTTTCANTSTSETRTNEYCTSSTSCGSYGSCSNTCGSGTKYRTCGYYYGGTYNSYTDSTSCSSTSGCSTSVSCGYYADPTAPSSGRIECYFSPNQYACWYASIWQGGTYMDENSASFAANSGSSLSGAKMCGGETNNGYQASNRIRFYGGKVQYACKNDTAWCYA